MRSSFPAALTILAVCSAVASAESTPPVEQVAQRGVLIVKCRTEIKDGLVNYRVLESWKGKYSAGLMYVKPIDGYLYPYGEDAKSRGSVDGQEVIFFYSDNAVSGDTNNKGKIRAHSPDLALPVIDGKITWSCGEFDATVYTLAELKKAVLAAAKDAGDRTPHK